MFQAADADSSAVDEEHKSDDDDGEASEAEVQDLIAASVKARGKQPNLSYFAFTATPTRRTLELFGAALEGGKRGPFHLYSMREAIEEGFIHDVLKRYTPYSVLWQVASTSGGDPPCKAAVCPSPLEPWLPSDGYPRATCEQLRPERPHAAGSQLLL